MSEDLAVEVEAPPVSEDLAVEVVLELLDTVVVAAAKVVGYPPDWKCANVFHVCNLSLFLHTVNTLGGSQSQKFGSQQGLYFFTCAHFFTCPNLSLTLYTVNTMGGYQSQNFSSQRGFSIFSRVYIFSRVQICLLHCTQ